jgi:hypothetical protein
MMRWLAAVLCLCCGGLAFSQTHTIATTKVYLSLNNITYATGNEACQASASYRNASQTGVVYSNPRHSFNGGLSSCIYDITHTGTGRVEYDGNPPIFSSY